MRAVIRGVRNIYRNRVRFTLVMVILGVAAGVSITMAQVSAGIAENLAIVAADYLALLEVRKAGADGMGVGADALPEEVVTITVDGANRRLEEHYAVQAEEPLTLIGLARVDAVYPGARLDAIEVDRRPVQLPFPEIVHLNLPPGQHEVRVLIGLGASTGDLTIQGTLLEPRRMFLIQGLDVHISPGPGARSREVEVRTVGLPPEIWERFKSTLLVAPSPTKEVSESLAVRYRFATDDAITLRGRPRIQVGPNNYPVMIRVTGERAAPSSP